ncbi:MAG: hypothetical protein AABY89_07645 [Acidobacteriota bacterium]
MIQIERVDTRSKPEVRRFVDLPFRLYEGHPHWVPPLRRDIALMLNRDKHPFYERSEAECYIGVRDGRDVGRLAVLDNRAYNDCHGTREANFYCFDAVDDQDVADALFARAFEWARDRGLNRMVGPKGFSAFDGYGILVDGFEHRPMMTMTNYNLPYYGRLAQGVGLGKDIDFVSYHMEPSTFSLPDRMRRVADRVRAKGSLGVFPLNGKRALFKAARRIGETYNKAFVHNWEYYPLSSREIDYLVEQLVLFANPKMIKLIRHGEDIVGFLFAFPDVSSALQRARGRLTPWTIADVLLEARRTSWVALNGAGILPEFQGRGGNALLYSEMERTMKGTRFHHGDLPQVAETAVQMRRDLAELGAVPYKTHRIYVRDL